VVNLTRVMLVIEEWTSVNVQNRYYPF